MTNEPGPQAVPLGATPRTARLLGRGLVRHCPACGSGRLFRHWLTMADTCPRCGLRFARIEGHWIGAIGINTIVSFAAFLLTTIVGVLVTFPDIPVLPLTLINAAVATIVPVAFHPVSRTLWTAIDIAMRPLEPHEVDWTQVRG
jgi:uncharacterized protein (DUF983 family)